MNYFPNGDEEIGLIKFIAKYQYLKISNNKYFFSSKKYYRNRVSNLVSKRFLKKIKSNLVLDELGIEYAKLFKFTYNRLRGNKTLLLDKMIYKEHPLSHKLKDNPISEYNPNWVKNVTKKVLVKEKNTEKEDEIIFEIEVIIKADDLQHTYIVNCKDLYSPGEYLKARIKGIDLERNIFELSAKDFIENPYRNIRKYITEGGEYTGKVIAFPKGNSGIIVQLDISNITCLVRVPARFNNYPHYLDKVLIKVTEIRENKKMIYAYLMRIIN